MIKSLQIAFFASLIATVMGSMIAIALSRYRFRGGAVVNMLLILPLTTPEICLGSSLLTLFLIYRHPGLGFFTILIAHVMFCVSFVALTVKARIRGFDWTLEDAAMDLGAPPFRTFRKVTMPLIMPGIIAAFMLSFSLSIDDYIITVFNSGSTVTFPIEIFNEQKVAVPPQIDVLASMILFVSIALIGGGTAFRLIRENRLRLS
jgi:spermidine/putrescine transport system permease protein